MSCEYQELELDNAPEVKRWSEETWRSKEHEQLSAALEKFGPCPERL